MSMPRIEKYKFTVVAVGRMRMLGGARRVGRRHGARLRGSVESRCCLKIAIMIQHLGPPTDSAPQADDDPNIDTRTIYSPDCTVVLSQANKAHCLHRSESVTCTSVLGRLRQHAACATAGSHGAAAGRGVRPSRPPALRAPSRGRRPPCV
jgi:hypothetical protein